MDGFRRARPHAGVANRPPSCCRPSHPFAPPPHFWESPAKDTDGARQSPGEAPAGDESGGCRRRGICSSLAQPEPSLRLCGIHGARARLARIARHSRQGIKHRCPEAVSHHRPVSPLPAEKPPPVRSSKDAPPDESRTTAPFHVQKPEKGRLCEEFPKLASHGLAQLPAIQRNREKTAGNAKPSRSRPRGLPPGRSRGGAAWPAAQVAAWPAAWGAAWPAAWVADCAASLGLWRGPNRHQPPSGVARGPYSRLPRRRMTIGATNKLPAKTNVFAGSWLMVLMCSSRQSVSRGWPRAHPDTGAGLGGRVPDGRHGMRRTARGLELRAGLHRAPHAAAAGPNCAGRGCSPGAASRARPGTRRTATPTP